MQKKIEEFVEKWNMLSEDDVVIAGISGGADSVCLLLVLDEMRKMRGFDLVAVHVNHQMRGEAADADEEFVRELCRRTEIPFEAFQMDVRGFAAEHRMSEEEAGREMRRKAFEQTAEKYGGTKIALAHHMDDNAETFFLHLARGSRLKGLGGIYPVNGKYIRPLLCVSRKEIEDYLAQKELSYCMDATNEEDTYMRNRIRNHVIPYFREEINPKTVEHVNGAMEQLREIQEYLEHQMREAYEGCVKETEEGIVLVKELFEEQQNLIQGMLVRYALSKVSGREKDLEKAHVESVTELMEKQTGRSVDLPYNMRAVRTYEGVAITVRSEEEAECVEEISLDFEKCSGVAEFEDMQISYRIFANPGDGTPIPKKTYTKWFDYDIIKQSVSVRTRRAGDKIVIGESGNTQKLKAFFINEKIPSEMRSRIPLIAEGNKVLWIVGYRQSKAYQVTKQTTTILEITINGGI